MDNKENLIGYRNVESIQLSPLDDEFRKYCELKLQSAEGLHRVLDKKQDR